MQWQSGHRSETCHAGKDDLLQQAHRRDLGIVDGLLWRHYRAGRQPRGIELGDCFVGGRAAHHIAMRSQITSR